MKVSEYRERSSQRLEKSGNTGKTSSSSKVNSVNQYREKSTQRYDSSNNQEQKTAKKSNSYINSFLLCC